MKKILVALLVVSAIGATSCKKETETVPVKSLKVNGNSISKVDNTPVSAWD